VTQVYGLTETYGHVTECLWQERWHDLKDDDRYAVKARTGIAMPMMEDITAMDPETMQQTPMDGVTQGEIMIRGNAVMKGYLKNPKATKEAFAGGYFHSGDIAIQHPDGYLQIADRAKDIIISGGENISSVEIEGVMMRHPSVLLCAVVAKPDPKWGRGALRLCRIEGRRDRDRGSADRLRARKAGGVQDTQGGGVSRSAQDLDRQDPEIRTAPGRPVALMWGRRARVVRYQCGQPERGRHSDAGVANGLDLAMGV